MKPGWLQGTRIRATNGGDSRFGGVFGALVIGMCATVGLQPAIAQDSTDHGLLLETFDAAWQIVYDTHYDTTFNGVDWIALRDELRPTVEKATATDQLRAVIEEMLDRLDQSHFALIPSEVADTLDPSEGDPSIEVGDVGMDSRFIGDQLVVTKVDPHGPAAQAGVRPGWVVVAVGEDRVDDFVARHQEVESRRSLEILIWAGLRNRLQGTPGSAIQVKFLDASDRVTKLELIRRPIPGEPVKIGDLPTAFAQFVGEQRDAPDGRIRAGYIWFNAWLVPLVRQFDLAMDDFRELDGIVVDLRGNTGGVGAMILGLAGHFLDDRVSLGTMRTRTTELKFITNPRRVSAAGQRVTPFDGPVAVLTDGLSASASEVFAGGMQAVGRVRVFGGITAGAVLPARMDRLPNGDVLYHAFGEFETTTGLRLEGRGVFPDRPVSVTREDLLTGRDAVLTAALDWIAAERGRIARSHSADDDREF